MKVFYYTIVSILAIASGADAGGLSNPIPETPTISVAPPSTSWGGFYAGVSAGQTKATTEEVIEYSETTQDSEEVAVIDQCDYDGAHSGGKKCTFPDSVDLADLFPGIQRCRGYEITCDMGGNRAFIKGATGQTYSYDTGETTTVYGPEIVTFFTETVTNTSENGNAGLFAGYRWDLGVILGVEATTDGTLSTAELSAGLPMGDFLAYGFAGAGRYDGDDGSVYGAGVAYRLSDSWTIGGKLTAGDFGDTTTETAALRVSYNF